MIISSFCVYVCELNWKKKKKSTGSKKTGSERCLEGFHASLDCWIPSLTMSTMENVALEGHIRI